MTKKSTHHHPAHQQNLKMLNRVIGQLEGVKRMVDERRYCVDILVQTRAAAAALKKIELKILKKHLEHCVAEAFEAKAPAKSATKVNELIQIMQRF
jgi:DNA-binding FrmR family transcriptional regulator